MIWLFETSVLCAILACILYYFHYRYATYWSSRGVPSIPPLPLVGNFLPMALLKQTPGVLLSNLYKKIDSDIAGIYVFQKPALLIKNPDLIKQMLVKDFKSFGDRYSTSDAKYDVLGTSNLFFLKNPGWTDMKKQLSPIFTFAKMRTMFYLTNEIGQDLETHVSNLVKSKEGEDVIEDVRDICAKYTTDSIATFAYGIKANCLSNPRAEFRKASKEQFLATFFRSIELLSIMFIPKMASFFRFKFFDKHVSTLITNIVIESIREREKSGIFRPDLIDTLVKMKKNVAMTYDDDILVSQAAILFAGGFETSSTSISFCLYELALQPAIQDRLREEIRKTLKECGGKLTYDVIVGMTYLDMVLSETLRKYPSLPFLDRVCSNKSGYQLPPPYDHITLEHSTPIYVPMLGLHMDPQYFPNPDKFDPERFTKEAKLERNPYCYIPFGSGPHGCIGERFGSYQSKTGLVYFLKDHCVKVCDQTPIPTTFNPRSFLLAPNEALMLKIERVD